jgi:hypothetical protein
MFYQEVTSILKFILSESIDAEMKKSVLALRHLSKNKWEKLFHFLKAEQLAAYFHYQCSQNDLLEAISCPRTRVNFRNSYVSTYAINNLYLEIASEVESVLESEGIDIAFHKGLAFVDCLYPALGLRSMFDIDLLIRAEQKESFCRVLTEWGAWINKDDPNGQAFLMILGENLVQFDVHCWIDSFEKLSFDQLTVRRASDRFPKGYIRTLEEHYMLYSLCDHMRGHRAWGKIPLRVLCDFHFAMRHFIENIQSETILGLAQADSNGDQNLNLFGSLLGILSRELGQEVPEECRDCLKPNSSLTLEELIDDSIASSWGESPGRRLRRYAAFRFGLRPRWNRLNPKISSILKQ